MTHAETIRRKHNLPDGCPVETPWGSTDYGELLAPGVYWVGTPSHGGCKVYPEPNARIPEVFRRSDGWYEEDCDWAIVAVFLPEAWANKPGVAAQADGTLRNWHWRAYEQHFGVTLTEAESFCKRQYMFRQRNKNNWVVTSAARKSDGFLECVATLGEERGGFYKGDDDESPRWHRPEERRFLVPESEYTIPMVIDPARHRHITL